MKKAFTLLELVFVIVVIGILVAVMLPRTKSNFLYEAAIQVQSHIRYTQHLAMLNDKFDANDTSWHKKRWQILFSDNSSGAGGKWAYTIFADVNGASTGNPTETEIAVNPQNSSQRMTGGQTGSSKLKIDNPNFIGMKKMNIGRSYGIVGVTFSNSCRVGTSTRLAFDYLGRPLKGNLKDTTESYDNTHLLKNDCNITLSDSSDSVTIQIDPETGYARIVF